jgi:sensor histidine kinase YesM
VQNLTSFLSNEPTAKNMDTAASPLPTNAGFPFRRLLKDAWIAVGLNVVAGLLIALVNGDPQKLPIHILYSMSIGMIALLIIDVARLILWDAHSKRTRRWLPFILIVVAAAPVSNYLGSLFASMVMGYELPSIASFMSVRNSSMIVFTLIAAIGAIAVFANRERLIRIEAEAAREKARAETIARQAMQAQLQLLQAQVEPHMLFNTLANLQGLIAIDPDRAAHMLDQLIQYLRATLSSSRAGTTTLEQEFGLIDAYLGLMAVRTGPRLSYRLDLPDHLRAQQVPPMLLQPMVENAIIHGLEPAIAGGDIVVTAADHGGELELVVRDTGLGLAAGARTGGTRVGITNTRERLHGLYGVRARLELEPALPQGTVARLTLPMDLS